MKGQPEDKFERRLRERLRSHETAAPEGAWDRIAEDLPPPSPWPLRITIVAIIGLLLGGWGWWASHSPAPSERASTSTIIEPSNSSSAAVPQLRPDTNSLLSLDAAVPAPDRTHPVHPWAPSGSVHLIPEPTADRTDTAQPSVTSERDQPPGPATPPLATQTPLTNIPERRRSTETTLPSAGSEKEADLPTSPPISRVQQTKGSHRITSQEEPTFDNFSPRPGTEVYRTEEGKARLSVDWAERRKLGAAQALPTITIRPASVRVPTPAATAPEDAPARDPWEAWFAVNPLLLYQQVTPDTSDIINVTALNRTTFSQDRFGVQVSTGLRYALGPRWAVKLGGYYRYTRQQWTYNYYEGQVDTFRVVQLDPQAIRAEPIYQTQEGTVRETNHHIGGLIGIEYQLSHRWLRNTISTELQTHYHQDQVAWHLYTGYLAEHPLNERWSFSGGLNFLWNFSGPGSQGEHFVLKPYGFGAQLGVNYRLGLKR